MRHLKSLIRLCLLYPIAIPCITNGQVIGIDMFSWDTGPITIGDSATQRFTISALDQYTPVEIGAIEIAPDLSGYFDISGITHRDEFGNIGIGVPAELYMGEFVYVDITYTPLTTGIHLDKLSIESNDTHDFPPAGTMFVDLTGRATDATQVPAPAAITLLLIGLSGCSLVKRRIV